MMTGISSILGFLKGFETEYEFYSKRSTELSKEHRQKVGESKLTVKEQIVYMPWNELKETYKKATDAEDKALMAVYTILPPRRGIDYRLMKISKTGNLEERDTNYLSIEGKKMNFFFNKGKTSYMKTQKGYTVAVPPALVTVLRAYFKEYEKNVGEYLFTNTRNEQWGESQFTSNVRKTFKRYTKKNIGINSLRHSKISDFLATNPTTNAKRELAQQMSHSIEMQSEYNRLSAGDFIEEEEDKLKTESKKKSKK
jgi:hypothetical protein